MLWFALNQGNALGRVTRPGELDITPLPHDATAPVGIAVGPDGAVWYAGIGRDVIGRLGPDGTIVEHPLSDGARPHAVTVDADGTVWFSEWGLHRVGAIDTDGTYDEIDLPDGVHEPHGITVAADGRVWTAAESGQLVVVTPG